MNIIIQKVCHPRVILAGILSLLLITSLPQSSQAQWFNIPFHKSSFLAGSHTWTQPQYYRTIYVDSLILRVYLLDTGTSVVRSIIPQTTSVYNLGSISNRFQSGFFDTLYFGIEKIYRGSGLINISNNLYFPSNKVIDFGSGNLNIASTSYNLMIRQYDGSLSDTTLYINGTDSSVTIYGDFKPSNNYLQNLGGDNNFWKTAYINLIHLSLISPRTSSGITIGSGVNPIVMNGVTRLESITFTTDSLGANKSDTARIGKHTWFVNCDAANNDTIYLSSTGITNGFVAEIMKIDANATYVVVMPKGGKTVNATTEDKFNTQGQTKRYTYRNNNWYITKQ